MTALFPQKNVPQIDRFSELWRNQWQELEAYREFAWELAEPETLHRARVLSRRLRATHKILIAALKPTPKKFLQDPAKAVTRALRGTRSWDVAAEYLKAGKLAEKWTGHSVKWLLKIMEERSKKKREQIKFPPMGSSLVWEKLLVDLSTSQLQASLSQLEEHYTTKLIMQAQKFLKSGSKKDLHQTRITLKGWRYHQEVIQYCTDSDNVKLLKNLKKYQTSWGHFNDGVELARHLKHPKVLGSVDKKKRIQHFRKLLKILKKELKKEIQQISDHMESEFLPWLMEVRT